MELALRALQASVCSSRLDGAILNIATYPVEHSVGYIIFVFLILPSLDAILHVGRAAALWRAIRGLYAHLKIAAYPLMHIHIHIRAHIHIHTRGFIIQDKCYG